MDLPPEPSFFSTITSWISHRLRPSSNGGDTTRGKSQPFSRRRADRRHADGCSDAVSLHSVGDAGVGVDDDDERSECSSWTSYPHAPASIPAPIPTKSSKAPSIPTRSSAPAERHSNWTRSNRTTANHQNLRSSSGHLAKTKFFAYPAASARVYDESLLSDDESFAYGGGNQLPASPTSTASSDSVSFAGR
ncbi:hypothetical protein CLOM_g23630 [Closterium sp. NIES-68]|nr:hypothetical protein CLOM_g23630 [Closterium sp. NIES-68]GJP70755.1 hypothetical protein CLOP_g1662 [Closterium sp. NIES-67]